jgi:sacsin
MLLFDTYIPQTWATLLEILVKYDQSANIFEAWPSIQADVRSGDYFYWSDIPWNVARHAVNLPIWPVLGHVPVTYDKAGSLLIASTLIDDRVLNALTQIGLNFTQPPEYITELILKVSPDSLKALSPRILHQELLVCNPILSSLAI